MPLRPLFESARHARLLSGFQGFRGACEMALLLWMLSFASTALANNSCSEGRAGDVFKPAEGADYCLLIQKLETGSAQVNPRVLVAFLHDSQGSAAELSAADSAALGLSSQLNASTIALQGHHRHKRPAAAADGLHHADFTPAKVLVVAQALDHLRALHPGKKILLVGHSGSAAMAALVASRFPASADAYLLAGCPCDLLQWRRWRNLPATSAELGPDSLRPLNEARKIRPGLRMSLVVGTRDDNTLAKFSESYAAALNAQGVKTRLTYAVGATHISVLRSPEFFMLAQQLAAELSR